MSIAVAHTSRQSSAQRQEGMCFSLGPDQVILTLHSFPDCLKYLFKNARTAVIIRGEMKQRDNGEGGIPWKIIIIKKQIK